MQSRSKTLGLNPDMNLGQHNSPIVEEICIFCPEALCILSILSWKLEHLHLPVSRKAIWCQHGPQWLLVCWLLFWSFPSACTLLGSQTALALWAPWRKIMFSSIFPHQSPGLRRTKSICVKKCLDKGGYIIFLGTISCPLILKMGTGPCVNTLYIKQDYAII